MAFLALKQWFVFPVATIEAGITRTLNQESLVSHLHVSLLCVLCITLSASVVHAQDRERQEAPEETPEYSSWSVGVGLGSPLITDSALGLAAITPGGAGGSGLGGFGGLGSAFGTFRATLEWQPSPSFALMWVVAGTYTSSTGSEERAVDTDPFQEEAPLTLESSTDTTSISAALGGRWILNPGSTIEISPYMLLIAGTGSSETESEDLDADTMRFTRTTTTEGQGLAVNLGMVIERELLEQMWIRVALSLITPSYSTASREQKTKDDAPLENSGDRLEVEISPRPSLELRLLF